MTHQGLTIRKATVEDVPDVLQIVNDFAKEQIMLPRSPLSIYEGLRDFSIIELGSGIVGCGALHVVWGDLAEIRSIAIRSSEAGKGLGQMLGRHLLEEAEGLLIPRVFAFTYVPDFFRKLGFRRVEHSELPHKVFGDCLDCPKFNCCDETAMLLELRVVDGQTPGTGPMSRPIPGLFQGPFPTPRREE